MSFQQACFRTILPFSTLLAIVLIQSEAGALAIPNRQALPAAVNVGPVFKRRMQYGLPAEGNNMVQQLLAEGRLESAIAEAEAKFQTGHHAGNQAGGLMALRKLKRDPMAMERALEAELDYAQQLASGIITDLRSLLGDIRRDPSDPDRLLRLS